MEETSTTNEIKKSQLWGRDFVIALQNYTYKTWKVRNEALHGSNKKENLKEREMQTTY